MLQGKNTGDYDYSRSNTDYDLVVLSALGANGTTVQVPPDSRLLTEMASTVGTFPGVSTENYLNIHAAFSILNIDKIDTKSQTLTATVRTVFVPSPPHTAR